MQLTCLHEITLVMPQWVSEDLTFDVIVQGVVFGQQSDPRSLSSSVVKSVGRLDPMVDKESEGVTGEIEREDDEIDPVVVIQEVDAHSGVVHLLALHPQQPYHGRSSQSCRSS